MDNETGTDIVPREQLPMPSAFSGLFSSNMFSVDMRDSKNVLKAYLEAQRNMGKVIRNKKNAAFGSASKYADLTSVLEAIDTAAQDAGLVLMQPFQYEYHDNKYILMLYTCIAHAESGEALVTALPLPQLTDPQKLGSAITYFRRYSLMTMFGLAPEDDDGNAAAGLKTPQVVSRQPGDRTTVVLGPNKTALKQAILDKGAVNKSQVKGLLSQIGISVPFDEITEDEAPAILTKLAQVSTF